VADGLEAPRGLHLSENNFLLVAETGAGRVLEITDTGKIRPVATGLPFTLDSGPGSQYPAGPSAVSYLDGDLFTLIGESSSNRFGRLYKMVGASDFVPVTGPTGIDLPATNRLANPYDLVVAPEAGGWVVSDSGRNALVAVSRSGKTTDYFRFDLFPIPGRKHLVEVVPTGITRGLDGALYVGSLTGFPYPDGMATVWRVQDRNNDGDAMDTGEVQTFVTGLSTVTDLAFGQDGALYIAEFTSNMMAVIEGGPLRETVFDHPGRILRWDGAELSTVVSDLISPTALLVVGESLYVSEEFAGRVRKLPIDS